MRKPSNLDAMIEALVRRMLATPPKPRKAAKKAMQPGCKTQAQGVCLPKIGPVVFMVKSAVFPKPGGKVWYDDQRDVHRQIFEGDETLSRLVWSNAARRISVSLSASDTA
jgi:hypothetical protein